MQSLIKWVAAGAAALSLASALTASAAPNPGTHFYIDGAPINRSWILGDATDWSVPLQGPSGRSAGGKIEVSPAVAADGAEALKVKFTRKKIPAQLGLYGNDFNIAAVRDLVALTIDVRVLKRPKGDLFVAIDCTWPCRAQVPIDEALKQYPIGEWSVLPIPLNCFKNENFDLTKVNGIFLLLGSGQVELELGDIRLERMPPEMGSCAK